MPNLSALLEGIFRLHGEIPRRWAPDGRAFAPVHLFVEVTYRCNLRCNFCQYLDIIEGTAEHVGPAAKDLSLKEILGIIDQFPRGRLISFSGGEALMRKDFGLILEYASRRHRTHVISNGALVSPAVAEQWVRLAPRYPWQNGYVLSCISLEGDEATHDRVVGRPGSWRRTVEGVRRLVRERGRAGKSWPKINMKLVVTRDTVDGLEDFAALAVALGADVVNYMAQHDLVTASGTLKEVDPGDRLEARQAVPEGVDTSVLRRNLVAAFRVAESHGLEVRLTPHVPIEEFVRHYSDQRDLDPSEYECVAAWSRLAAGADGRWTPACYYLRDGDTREVPLADAWNSTRTKEFRRRLRERGVFPGCNGCCNLRYKGPVPMGLAGIDDAAGA